MVIRKVEAPKVSKKHEIPVEAPALRLKDVTDALDRALLDGTFSQKEQKGLDALIQNAPKALKEQAAAHLTAELEKRQQAGKPVDISEVALSKLSQALGTDFSKLFFRRQAHSETTSREVTQGLDKTAQTVEASHSAEVHKQGSEARLEKQKNIQASHNGTSVAKNELTPEYKAAKIVADELKQKGTAYLHEKAEGSPALAATLPHLENLAGKTVEEVMKDPELLANASSLLSKLGTPGFREALKLSVKDLGTAFTRATGTDAMNPAAVKAALDASMKLSEKLPALAAATGNAKLIEAAGRLAPQIGKTAATVGAKVGVQAGAAGAVTVGATAGKAIPVIGNVISVGTTLMAGATFVGQLFKKPHDMKKIANEGAYFLTQAVGIAFPWVALGGSLAKIGTDAAIRSSDKKKAERGEVVTEQASMKDITAALPFLAQNAELMEAALRGAGKGDAADKVARLRTSADSLSKLPEVTPEQLGKLREDQQAALTSVFETVSGRLGEIKDEERQKDPTSVNSAIAMLLGKGFQLASTALRKSGVLEKNLRMPGGELKPADVDTKRSQNAGELVASLGPTATAQTVAGSV
ncbi:MAG: hypothetical protein HYS27_23390 [Deltaproteobacteria bacterium]|nr:hypothetical protein [Deltaproteobacteria bacterium]